MTTTGELLYTALANDAGVAALVSTRIYPLLLPQSPTYGAITYHRISNGPHIGGTDYRNSRYQLDCWETTHPRAEALANAVKSALEAHKDEDQTPSIKMVRVVNEIENYEDDTESYRIIIDVMVSTIGD